MFTFSYHFCHIAVFICNLFQGVCINIEPGEWFSDGVLVLHLETLFSVIAHIIGQFYDAVLILEHIAYIRRITQP